MIRVFTVLKSDLKQLPDAVYLYEELSKDFKPSKAVCAKCGSFFCLSEHDSYKRWLISYEKETVKDNRIDVRRIICKSCEGTHAILPDILVPYKSYCIIFILYVLKAYFFRTESVRAIAERYKISVTTIYTWKKRFLSHKSIELGALEKYFYKNDQILEHPQTVCFTDILRVFFKRFGFSFMQHYYATESRGSPKTDFFYRSDST